VGIKQAKFKMPQHSPLSISLPQLPSGGEHGMRSPIAGDSPRSAPLVSPFIDRGINIDRVRDARESKHQSRKSYSAMSPMHSRQTRELSRPPFLSHNADGSPRGFPLDNSIRQVSDSDIVNGNASRLYTHRKSGGSTPELMLSKMDLGCTSGVSSIPFSPIPC
jgi:hypothetical protein